MKTYFASAERVGKADIIKDLEEIANDPVINGLMGVTGGVLVAVLNRHRQIVALNTSFVEMVGIDDPEEALGLRPGNWWYVTMPPTCRGDVEPLSSAHPVVPPLP